MQNTNLNFSSDLERSLAHHFDEASAFYFKEELTTKLPLTFQTLYASLNGPKLVPVKNTIDPMSGYRFSYYDVIDMAGKPKWASDRSTDSPDSDVKVKRNMYQTSKRRLKFDFTKEDIALASRGNRSLIDNKRLSTIQGHAQDTNKLIFFGDYDNSVDNPNFFGWVNHPNITKTEVAPGTGGKTWATKTGLEMVKDLNSAVDSIMSDTNNVHTVDTIALPILQYRALYETPVGNGINTAAEFFNKANPNITLVPANELKGAYPGNKDMFIAYQKSEMNFWFETSELIFTDIFQKEIDLFQIQAEVWHGGIILIYPKSQIIKYGI